MILRPYQEHQIGLARQSMREGCKRLILEAPTGAGKTVMTAFMVSRAREKMKRTYFLVHRRELLEQSIETFSHCGIKCGILSPGFSESDCSVQIATVQTLHRRLERWPIPDMVIWDECHHIAAKTWGDIHSKYCTAFHVGLTATPARLDGVGLGGWFDKIIRGPSVQDLISRKYLSDYKIFCPSSVDMSGVRKQMGDWAKGQSEGVVNRPTITGTAVAEYKKRCDGKSAIVFCVSRKHSIDTANAFTSAGIFAVHVDGDTPHPERKKIFEQFRLGRIHALCNVEIATEGVDVPGIQCEIQLRPTQSMTLYRQMLGRALRPCAMKEHAIILDHVGNAIRHGLPDDEIEWSLDGVSSEQKKKQTLSVKICDRCYGANRIAVSTCMFCGTEFKVKERNIKHIDGELEEVDRETIRRARKIERGQCKTYAELIEYGKKQGYKNPGWWARCVLRGRKEKASKHKVSSV